MFWKKGQSMRNSHFLQETAKKIGRQLLRMEKTLKEANLEIQELKEQLEDQVRASSRLALHICNRKLELQVANLQNRIRQLEGFLNNIFFSTLPAPPLFERTYSFLD
jgi:DNA-binding transcriptional MerR regulator